MVVHLWGKFFMAAWRGRRTATWITGVVAFLVSIGDGLHRLPLPAELRLAVDRHPGQGRHQRHRRRGVLQRPQLRPDADVAHRAAPARRRRSSSASTSCSCGAAASSRPSRRSPRRCRRSRPRSLRSRPPRRRLTRRSGAAMSAATQPWSAARQPPPGASRPDRDVEEWHGPYVRYDIVKEFVSRLSSCSCSLVVWPSSCSPRPTTAPVTLKSWSTATPVDFAQTAITELDGTSPTATYGPPYNDTPGREPGASARSRSSSAHRRAPSRSTPPRTSSSNRSRRCRTDPALDAALAEYTTRRPCRPAAAGRTPTRSALADASFSDGPLVARPGHYGPVAVLIGDLDVDGAKRRPRRRARRARSQFYGTNYTKPLLFLADGTYLANLAAAAAPARRPVGDDERDRELPRPGVALALHLLVPDPARSPPRPTPTPRSGRS